MGARRINPLALMLGIAAVLGIGSMMVTMTDPQPPSRAEESTARSLVMDMPAPPPREMAMPREAESPRLADIPPIPNVSPTSAPGVAFNYRYAFRLAGNRVARVQEQHASTCERLGVARCRITGMRYRVADEGGVEALLALRLEPGIARRFGRAGAEAVAAAEGRLVDAEISGSDTDASVRAAGRSIAQMRADLQRIEVRLGERLSAEERPRLEHEAQLLRQSIRAAEAGRDEQREALASTPMVFHYASSELALAHGGPDVGKAMERAGDNFLQGVAILLIVAVTLLPWLLLAGLAWWLFRSLRRRFEWSLRDPEPSPA